MFQTKDMRHMFDRILETNENDESSEEDEAAKKKKEMESKLIKR